MWQGARSKKQETGFFANSMHDRTYKTRFLGSTWFLEPGGFSGQPGFSSQAVSRTNLVFRAYF